MDDFYIKKAQIEDQAQKAKDETDRLALEQKQRLADEAEAQIRKEAEEKIVQIQNEAQQ
jgi:hypothetical protein